MFYVANRYNAELGENYEVSVLVLYFAYFASFA